MVLDKGDCLPSGDIFVSRMSMKHMTSLRIRYCTRMHLDGGKNCGGLWRGRGKFEALSHIRQQRRN